MISTDEYSDLDATGLADLVSRREVSASELLECAVELMDRLNPALNAIVMRNDKQARTDAQSIDNSLPLCGVPFLAKKDSYYGILNSIDKSFNFRFIKID